MDRRPFVGTLAAVICMSGCATPPDWIERTLVTGRDAVLFGTSSVKPGAGYPELLLDLATEEAEGEGRLRGRPVERTARRATRPPR
jgi:hypothetical protein